MSAPTMRTAGEAAETYAVLARAFAYPSAGVGRGHLESEYMATFEQGRVPLYEGLCRSADERFWVQEEVLRFYHHFDVRLSSSDRDYPDHFSTELEFMRHLTELEAAAPTEEARRSLQRAQRDFLVRHLSAWSERLPALIQERAGAKAYLQFAQCAQSAVRDHIDHLNRVLGDA